MNNAKSHFYFLVSITTIFLFLAGTSLAAVHHVATSEELNTAIATALDGDTIELADGVYDLDADNQIDVGLTMRGVSDNPESAVVRLTELDQGIAAFLSFQGTGPLVFQGLTFMGFDAWATLLGHNFGLELENCIFRNNTALAVLVGNSGISVRGCQFLENSVQTVISSNASLTASGCSFRDNVTVQGVMTVEFGDIDLADSEITGNSGACVQVPPNGLAVFSQCLFTGNQGPEEALRISADVLEMTACTIAANSYPEGGLGVWGNCHASLVQCDILANGDRDGTLGFGTNTVFTCCEVDLVRWLRYGSFTLDDDDCTVAIDMTTWGGVKATYR